MQVNDDPRMLEALQVLVDAVRRERIPGVVEFRQLEDALKSIAEEPTQARWATADAAFNALDPDLRVRVADRAHQLAHKEAKSKRDALGSGTPETANQGARPVTLEGAAIAAGAPLRPPANRASPRAEAAKTEDQAGTEKPAPKRSSASPFLAALNRGKLGAR